MTETSDANVCAYCGKTRKLTREHILPDCIQRRTDDYDLQYVSAAETKLVGGDPTVRDVCSYCNNSRLTVLDSYLCGLWDSHFRYFSSGQERVEFRYDFDLLTRSLLKICFNSARANRSYDRSALATCAEYILEGHARPTGLAVFARIVVPTNWKSLDVSPAYLRVALAEPSEESQYAVCRTVQFNAFQFFVLIARQEVSRVQRRRQLSDFARAETGVQRVAAQRNRIQLAPSSVDTIAAVRSHFIDNWALYSGISGANGEGR